VDDSLAVLVAVRSIGLLEAIVKPEKVKAPTNPKYRLSKGNYS
jgi:hypothetical protein